MLDTMQRPVNLQYATDATLKVARNFVNSELGYKYGQAEEAILNCFFSNLNKRAFFIKNLPPGVSASLISMYSRMGNPRGIRGIFLDSFLPSILAGKLSEVIGDEKWSEDSSGFLAENKVKSLEDFTNLSNEASLLVFAFTQAFQNLMPYSELLTDSGKAKRFIKLWLEKYGHNSIGRMAGITLCIEGCSMLTAKSIEWGRPGIGFVELSSRYVDLKNAKCYPICEELAALGFDPKEVKQLRDSLFEYYECMQGDNQNGYFPNYLREKHSELFKKAGKSDASLAQGIFGECCDVGGNFLPLCTLTSVGVQTSGESFSMLLKHLLLDATSENIAFVELIISESTKVGVDQFLGHYEPTEAERRNRRYLSTKNYSDINSTLPKKEMVEETLEKAFNLTGIDGNLNDVADYLYYKEPRLPSSFQKLPAEFEHVTVSFYGRISMRSWRDVQRMGFSTHNRSLVTPYLGFYRYDKPAPECLYFNFRDIAQECKRIYSRLKSDGCSPNLLQYILPMGFEVAFSYSCNLRQAEFSIWQRTKPEVNDEVRKAFLRMNQILLDAYPWWYLFSRCNLVPRYLFARGGSNLRIK